MSRAALVIRHGRTAWNDAGRVQGQTDIPLCDAGRAQVASWRVPPEFGDAAWFCSPLARAAETARLLGHADARRDPRLAEMSWGIYEGLTLARLSEIHGMSFAANEARGLDFHPPGGESPRMVAARLSAFLGDVAGAGNVVIVAHKGVLRASLVLALGWDMRGPAEVHVEDDVALLYDLAPSGEIQFVESVPLPAAPS